MDEHVGSSASAERMAGPSVSVGHGWLMPAALVTFFLATAYLPAHEPGAPGIDALIALLAALYAAGLGVAAPRLARAVVLRLVGQPIRVVLLGATGDELSDAQIAARWRLAAIAAGGVAALVALSIATALVVASPTESYRHAIAVASANVALLVGIGTVAPAPPFVGWSLVLAILDGLGVARATRTPRAAALARGIAIPLILGVALLAAPLDPWMTLPLALLALAYVWYATTIAIGRDGLDRFLEAHRVADLARPPIRRVAREEQVPAEFLADRRSRGAVFVERAGFLIGAIGTHRLRWAAGPGRATGASWAAAMVPVAQLRWLHVSDPATRVRDALRAGGVALVIVGSEIQAIEEDDLFDQAAAWVRSDTTPPHGVPGT